MPIETFRAGNLEEKIYVKILGEKETLGIPVLFPCDQRVQFSFLLTIA